MCLLHGDDRPQSMRRYFAVKKNFPTLEVTPFLVESGQNTSWVQLAAKKMDATANYIEYDRHQGAANFDYFDGHVEIFREKDTPMSKQPPGGNNFFYSESPRIVWSPVINN